MANEVETEQIVADMVLTAFHKSGMGYFDSNRYTSFVQHRGSIPLFWTQEASNLTAKPPIEITVRDPFLVLPPYILIIYFNVTAVDGLTFST